MNAPSLRLDDCPRCESPLERGDLRCAVCAYAVRQSASTVEAPRANVVRCDGCGACVSYDVAAQAPRCAFCGAVTHVEAIEDPVEQAEAALPFEVDRDAAQAALSRWLGTRGFFCPSDLKQTATVAQLKPLWWPAWVFDARTEVSWAADSNAGSRRSSWAPHAGTTEADFENVVVSASRGLSAAECLTLGPATNLSTARAAADGPEGVVTEQFDLQRSSARRRILEVVESLAEEVAAREIPGSSHRKLHTSVVLRGLRTRRLSIPTWVLAYRYRGELHRALVHGQDPNVVLGSTPTSWLKVGAVVVAAALALALLVALLGS